MTREEKAQFCMDHPYKTPAFQLYPADWFGSGHVSMMSISQRGVHATMIFSAWLTSECAIPENDVCAFARIPCEQKAIALEVLGLCWFLYQGFWFCERLLNERIKQLKVSNSRSIAGVKGGRPLKSRINKEKAKGFFSKAKESKSEDEDEDEDEIEKEEENKDAIESEIPQNEDKTTEVVLPDHLKEIWPRFIEMRQSLHKKPTSYAVELLIKKLYKLSPLADVQVKIVEQSIANSWQGFFPLKTEQQRYGRQEVDPQVLKDQAKRFMEAHNGAQ